MSHSCEMYSMGNIVNNYVIVWWQIITRLNRGDYFEVYRNVKSLYCVVVKSRSVVGQLYFKNKHIVKEIRFVVTRGGEWEEGEWNEGGQKVQTSSCKISTRDVMCNMINITNTAVCHVWKLSRINPKSSHYKKKILLSISLILCLYEMMDGH